MNATAEPKLGCVPLALLAAAAAVFAWMFIDGSCASRINREAIECLAAGDGEAAQEWIKLAKAGSASSIVGVMLGRHPEQCGRGAADSED